MSQQHPNRPRTVPARQTPAKPSGPLGARLLRGVQALAGVGGASSAQLDTLKAQSTLAAALQLARVSVETLSEIRADADRQCEAALAAPEGPERRKIVERVGERVRDLHLVAGKARIPGHGPLPKETWTLSLQGAEGDQRTVAIPALNALRDLEAHPGAAGEREWLDRTQAGLNTVRQEILESRAALLQALKALDAMA